MKLYIGNIDYKVSEEDLALLFSPFATFSQIHVIRDNQTSKSKGFAFAVIDNDIDAIKAMTALNDSQYENRRLIVREAKKQ